MADVNHNTGQNQDNSQATINFEQILEFVWSCGWYTGIDRHITQKNLHNIIQGINITEFIYQLFQNNLYYNLLQGNMRVSASILSGLIFIHSKKVENLKATSERVALTMYSEIIYEDQKQRKEQKTIIKPNSNIVSTTKQNNNNINDTTILSLIHTNTDNFFSFFNKNVSDKSVNKESNLNPFNLGLSILQTSNYGTYINTESVSKLSEKKVISETNSDISEFLNFSENIKVLSMTFDSYIIDSDKDELNIPEVQMNFIENNEPINENSYNEFNDIPIAKLNNVDVSGLDESIFKVKTISNDQDKSKNKEISELNDELPLINEFYNDEIGSDGNAFYLNLDENDKIEENKEAIEKEKETRLQEQLESQYQFLNNIDLTLSLTDNIGDTFDSIPLLQQRDNDRVFNILDKINKQRVRKKSKKQKKIEGVDVFKSLKNINTKKLLTKRNGFEIEHEDNICLGKKSSDIIKLRRIVTDDYETDETSCLMNFSSSLRTILSIINNNHYEQQLKEYNKEKNLLKLYFTIYQSNTIELNFTEIDIGFLYTLPKEMEDYIFWCKNRYKVNILNIDMTEYSKNNNIMYFQLLIDNYNNLKANLPEIEKVISLYKKNKIMENIDRQVKPMNYKSLEEIDKNEIFNSFEQLDEEVLLRGDKTYYEKYTNTNETNEKSELSNNEKSIDLDLNKKEFEIPEIHEEIYYGDDIGRIDINENPLMQQSTTNINKEIEIKTEIIAYLNRYSKQQNLEKIICKFDDLINMIPHKNINNKVRFKAEIFYELLFICNQGTITLSQDQKENNFNDLIIHYQSNR